MARKAKRRLPAKKRTPGRAKPDVQVLGRAERITGVADRKAVPDPVKDPFALESFMAETNGGGSIEKVPGFDIFRAVTSGFATRRVAGPTAVMARPDGGFF